MKKELHGKGTVRPRIDSTGVVIGYRALLPRRYSTPPNNCKNPERYQEQIGDLFASAEEAREVLDAAILALREKREPLHGLPVSHYVDGVIQSKLHEALRAYRNEAEANKNVSTWKSIAKLWLSKAPFIDWVPAAVDARDISRFVERLLDRERGASGQPLSGSYVRNIILILRLAFERANVKPNPAAGLDLPNRSEPEVRFMDLASQRRFFGCKDIDLDDRIMAGCGLGAGLRVGELLSIEVVDVRAHDADPHLIIRYGGDHHAPTKGRKIRRVEIYEPGLGFWRLALTRFAKAGQRRLFVGVSGGYLKHWPENFPAWGELTSIDRCTSHLMRHTFAVSMLSGTWGYEPQSLEFLMTQLGHGELKTTQRYYAAFEAGTWSRQVRAMTGQTPRGAGRAITTAAELLGIDAASDAAGNGNGSGSHRNILRTVESPSVTPNREIIAEIRANDASRLHPSRDALRAQLIDALERVQRADPFALVRAVEAMAGALRLLDELAESELAEESRHG